LGSKGKYQDFSVKKSVVSLIDPLLKNGRIGSQRTVLETLGFINHKPCFSKAGWNRRRYETAERRIIGES
jgi:hypothetical protein